MTFGSLFSGIGGIEEGLINAGMELKWQVENNEYCQKILNQDWPDIPKYKDIKEVGKHNLETVDLIAGGFPCQPFSVAGKREGTEDNRFLWPEMLRVIQELRPLWVFAENVPGILSINGGMVIEQVLSSLENEGYETMPPFIIPACAVDASHRRDRVWIMAYSEFGRWGGRCNENVQRQNGALQTSGSRSTKKQRVLADTKENTLRTGLCKNEQAEIRGARLSNGGGNVPDTNEQHGNGGGFYSDEVCRKQSGQDKIQKCGEWFPEPRVGRVADGIPDKKNRLEALGNAVVPQLVEMIGKAIMHSNKPIHLTGNKDAGK